MSRPHLGYRLASTNGGLSRPESLLLRCLDSVSVLEHIPALEPSFSSLGFGEGLGFVNSEVLVLVSCVGTRGGEREQSRDTGGTVVLSSSV